MTAAADAVDRPAPPRESTAPWRAVERWIPVALFAVAALYFAPGTTVPLEWVDEGMLVYPAWLVSLGEVPYRDFQHAYLPASFALNGALFALFGPDLLVIRAGLVLVKAVVAALVYVATRQIATRASALAAAAIVIVVWGLPVWVFNAPYANHYVMPLALLAIVLLARGPSAGRCVAAGLLLGTAATFKQTIAALLAGALVVALYADRTPRRPERSATRGGWTALNLAALAGATLLPIAYTSRHLLSWPVPLLIVPYVAAGGSALLAMWRDPADAAIARVRARALLGLGTGMLAPLAVVAVLYLRWGALSQLAFDTLGGMLARVEWYHPFEVPQRPTVVLVLALAIFFAAVRWAQASAMRAWSVLAVAAVTVLAGLIVRGGTGPTARALVGLVQVLPLLLVWGTAPLVWGSGGPGRARWAWAGSAAAAAQLYPSADAVHAAMLLPLSLPLLGLALDRYVGDGVAAVAPGRVLRRATVTAAIVAICVPAVLSAASALRSREPAASFARATRVRPTGSKSAAAAELVRYLDDSTAAETPLWALANEQILYFLAARRSPLQRWEMAFYFITTGLLRSDDVPWLLDEREVVETLAATRPVIVDAPGPASARMRAALPAVAAYVAANYRPAQSFGPYVVLRHT